MQIEITDPRYPENKDRFYVASELVVFDKNSNAVSINRNSNALLISSIAIEDITDKELFLRGLLNAASGTGVAPTVVQIRITFL